MTSKTIVPRVERIKRVWTLDAKLYIPHQEQELSFASPSFGPNTYQNVGQEILSHGFKVPTGDYTASLLHSVYCNSQVKEESEFKNIRELMRRNWLWVFNKNLWTDKGVYVIQDLKAKGRNKPLSVKQLERTLGGSEDVKGARFSKDGIVRFAPKETYRLGEHTPQSLSEDSFIIASYNVDGAKKLEEVSATFQVKPYVHGVEVSEGNAPELRVSALSGGLHPWLHLYGFVGGNGGSHAFGVLDSAEGSAKK